jgi:hypothetical protein
MCFDAETSINTFIGGTVVNVGVLLYALKHQQTSLVLISVLWFFIITMQFWEYCVWSNWHSQFAERMAYVFNIAQIPLLYFLFIVVSPVPDINKYIASAIVLLYLCIVIYPTGPIQIVKIGHLEYSWWNEQYKSATYLIACVALFLLLVRPFKWSVCCVVTLFILWILSRLIYGDTGVPSLWCNFAVFFPILALVYAQLTKEDMSTGGLKLKSHV